MFENIWEAIKTHKWVAIGIGGAVVVGVIIYYVAHKNSSSSTTSGQDLLATSGSGPTTSLTGDGSTAGGGGGNGISPASPVSPVNPIDLSGSNPANPITQLIQPTFSVAPDSFTPPPTNPAAPSVSVPGDHTNAPINGLTGVNYTPNANTPNQVIVGSANGLTQIALPVGETLQTPVTVNNASAGNPVVPLGDLISTGSTNTLSSAYGNAQTAAVASESVDPGTQAALNALVAAQFGAAGGLPKTMPISSTPSTKIISTTPSKTTIAATGVNAAGVKSTTVVSTAPAAGHLGVMKPS